MQEVSLLLSAENCVLILFRVTYACAFLPMILWTWIARNVAIVFWWVDLAGGMLSPWPCVNWGVKKVFLSHSNVPHSGRWVVREEWYLRMLHHFYLSNTLFLEAIDVINSFLVKSSILFSQTTVLTLLFFLLFFFLSKLFDRC